MTMMIRRKRRLKSVQSWNGWEVATKVLRGISAGGAACWSGVGKVEMVESRLSHKKSATWWTRWTGVRERVERRHIVGTHMRTIRT